MSRPQGFDMIPYYKTSRFSAPKRAGYSKMWTLVVEIAVVDVSMTVLVGIEGALGRVSTTVGGFVSRGIGRSRRLPSCWGRIGWRLSRSGGHMGPWVRPRPKGAESRGTNGPRSHKKLECRSLDVVSRATRPALGTTSHSGSSRCAYSQS